MDVVNRTFVGILVPPPVIAGLQDAVSALKRRPGAEQVRWNSPNELLIQLASLGELGPGSLASAADALTRAIDGFPRLQLSLSGFAGLPNAVQPRFACVDLSGDLTQLHELAGRVERAASSVLGPREVRPFRASITVGRLKIESESARVGLGRALRSLPAPQAPAFTADAVELCISQAGDSGIGFQTVRRFPLGGA